ncbi:MAG: TVP38/TMEM64 family protein [Alphaproteobacteria bacterium]|nr:MAG: TVP38/TMEM64 family protein [Alphaproteobacteria bacterium]
MSERLLALAQAWAELGLVGLCALALVFALGTLTVMPRFTFYSIGGAVFGPAAVPAAMIGSLIGAAAAFLLARTWLHEAFQRQADKRPKWRRLCAAIDAEGWRIVALTRVVSPLPGGMINYVFGLTRIAFVPYIVATAGGLLPPIATFAGLGMLGRIALSDSQPSPTEAAISAASIIVMGITALLIVRRMRALPH